MLKKIALTAAASLLTAGLSLSTAQAGYKGHHAHHGYKHGHGWKFYGDKTYGYSHKHHHKHGWSYGYRHIGSTDVSLCKIWDYRNNVCLSRH